LCVAGGVLYCVLYHSINVAVYSLVAHYLNDIVMILAAKTQALRHSAVVVIGGVYSTISHAACVGRTRTLRLCQNFQLSSLVLENRR
jgi:hypothetical protein